MFQKYRTRDVGSKIEVSIIDDSFTESIYFKYKKLRFHIHFIDDDIATMMAVIKIYSNKQLDIPQNLYLVCRLLKEDDGWCTIKDLMKALSRQNKRYKKYRKEVMSYHKRYKKLKSFW